MFQDRADAAHQLAIRLAHLRGQRPLILAVPRGAVPDVAAHLDAQYLAEETARQQALITRRRALYGAARIDPAGRLVVMVDDGVATGATLIAALEATRARQPARLLVAIGVAPPDALVRLRARADEVVCLQVPENFSAVGQFYRDFGPVTDDDVTALLGAWRAGSA